MVIFYLFVRSYHIIMMLLPILVIISSIFLSHVDSFYISKQLPSKTSSHLLFSSIDSTTSSENKLIGTTLLCNYTGFNGLQSMPAYITLQDKSKAKFWSGIESVKPGFWRIIPSENPEFMTLEVTHPVLPEYLLFFDIWEPTILWTGDINIRDNIIQNGKITTNKNRFGIFPYKDEMAVFDARLVANLADVPKLNLPNFSDQSFIAPFDFESPYDMKQYPQYFSPEFREYFFSVEEALARGEEPPKRPQTFFVPNPSSRDDSSSVDSVGTGFDSDAVRGKSLKSKGSKLSTDSKAFGKKNKK